MTKKKVEELKKIEEDKQLQEVKKIHEQQKNLLENEQKDELDNFNQIWDSEYINITTKILEEEENIKLRQEKEISSKLEESENDSMKIPKPSMATLNLTKILEQAIKQKEYTKAHELQIKLNDLNQNDMKKFEIEKSKKKKRELEKLKIKMENELNTFQAKSKGILNEFKKNRTTEFEKNRKNELENSQKLEINNFPKIIKGISKPNSRIVNILNSASMNKGLKMMMKDNNSNLNQNENQNHEDRQNENQNELISQLEIN